MMKKTMRALVFVLLLLLALSANADVLAIPDGITSIESEAFSDIAKADAIFIPASAQEIASDAFGSAGFTVYGLPGTAAEAFAEKTGRSFVSVEITNIQLETDAWHAPDADFTLSAKATSVEWFHSYRFEILKDGVVCFDTGYTDANTATVRLSKTGVYDVRVYVRHRWVETSQLFPMAFEIGEPVRFTEDASRLNVKQTKQIVSADETRSVTLASEDSTIVRVSGRSVTGLQTGSTFIVATAAQDEGTVVTRIPIEVCIPVDSVELPDAPESLFVGTQAVLPVSVLPLDASYPQVTWTSSDDTVLSVTEFGVVRALKQGSATITAAADGVAYEHPMRATIPVETLTLSTDHEGTLLTRETLTLTAEALPEIADDKSVLWTSSNEKIARVSTDGVVTAVSAGSCDILATANDLGGATSSYAITVEQGIEKISLSADKTTLHPDEALQLSAVLSPDNAVDKALVWSSSAPSIAMVDQNGLVTPTGAGVVTIYATSRNGVTAAVTLRVYSSYLPEEFVLESTSMYMNIGETYQLTFTVYPEDSDGSASWKSSKASVVTVDKNGTLKAVGAGTATVSVYSTLDASVSASIKITVLNPTRTLVMPDRRTTTSTAKLKANLNKISAVKTSAIRELDALKAQGKISSTNYKKRSNLVSAAFEMYSFPWVTLSRQPYWKEANSENGAKDFKPHIMYYGMPYISTNYPKQRLYTPAKAVSENRYYKSETGNYYILNQDNLINGQYCGNDCSSMVAMCYFGVNASGIGNWNTRVFVKSELFTTLSTSAELYPGDIIVRNGHVVMFLYYVSDAHDEFVVIEQGGLEAGINTVSTSIYTADHYYNDGYRPRRYNW